MSTLVIGALGGVAFVVACESMPLRLHFDGGAVSAGSDARAAPADCASWQIAYVPAVDLTSDGTGPAGNSAYRLPAGWEPIAYTQGSQLDYVTARRCAP
jgi:hypothetical protein